jgi:hypothetical protein
LPSIPRLRAASRALALAVLSGGSFACGGGGGGGSDGGVALPVDLASVTPTPRTAAVEATAGAFAADYLRSTNFTRLVVEVDYPATRPPTPAALELLRDRLAERCDKPDGVVVVADDGIPESEMLSVMSIERVEGIEDRWRDTFSDLSTRTAAMYVLYVTGHSDEDANGSQILGIAHRGGSIAYFVDRAERGDDLFVTTAEIEGAGLVHEAGHLLGLVGNGVPQVRYHVDPGSYYHDVNPDCVMYYIVHVSTTEPNIGDEDFAQFDRECVDDLQAFGGLGPWPGLEAQRVRAASRRPSEQVEVGVCACGRCGAPARRR